MIKLKQILRKPEEEGTETESEPQEDELFSAGFEGDPLEEASAASAKEEASEDTVESAEAGPQHALKCVISFKIGISFAKPPLAICPRSCSKP